MNGEINPLDVLLMEDDKENLALLVESLPKELNGYKINYEPCNSFDNAKELLKWRRFDLVLSDIYRDRSDQLNKSQQDDVRADRIVDEIKSRYFSPIVLFTDGTHPEDLQRRIGPFLKLVDKTRDENIIAAIREILETGIPQLSRRIHDELDRGTGPEFLWGFLEANWDALGAHGQNTAQIVERLIRRRASILIDRLELKEGALLERVTVSPAELYIIPPISEELRLGVILRDKRDGRLYMVLTPHCHLHKQENQGRPRAEHVLLAPLVEFNTAVAAKFGDKKPSWQKGKEEERKSNLRKVLKIPAEMGQPNGRYCFLPGFLNIIPDSFCDFMTLQSFPFEDVQNQFERVAALDSPFAEAIQSCLTAYYATVGLPETDLTFFERYWNPPEE